jgi:threonine/homoserine/homoserine lactone efflux protein
MQLDVFASEKVSGLYAILLRFNTAVVGLAILWLTFYAVTAARARQCLQKPSRATMFNRCTGLVFLVAAGLMATTRRRTA